jgi:hypothetical protein
MLVSKLREPTAHPKRPAWVVFDLLNLIRLHLDTCAELQYCHTSQSVLLRLSFSSDFYLRDSDLVAPHTAGITGNKDVRGLASESALLKLFVVSGVPESRP